MAILLMTPAGNPVQNPEESDMISALTNLLLEEDIDAEAMLSDENGWSLSVYSNGSVIFENLDLGEAEKKMFGKSQEEILGLWKLLAAGNLEELKAMKWDEI